MIYELFTDEEIDEFVKKIYNSKRCIDKRGDYKCDKCSRRDEIAEDVCWYVVIMDLWRKWKNAKSVAEKMDEIV